MSAATPDSGPISESDSRNPVDVLADEFARRLREGETPSVDEYIAAHPELATQIRAVFPAIAKMEKASRHQLSNSGSSAPLRPFELNLERIGDFEIIRTIGQGGMGIVYEALQLSLRRNVALKVISPAISNSPKQLERFKREAATAARLHHTNIVPVFGSGEEDGIHYYAMQLIEGIPLNEAVRNIKEQKTYAIESLPSDFLSEVRQSQASVASNEPTIISDEAREFGNQPGTSASLGNSGFSGGSHDQDSAATSLSVNQSEQTGTTRLDDTERLKKSDLNQLNPDASSNEKEKLRYWKKICELVAEIADALEYANGQGVMHRDIKPSNLLMDGNGTVWITDFGLAKFDEHDVLTKTGDIVGTLRYMAPEQFSGEGDGRSDICSLGLTLYELLVLEPAYTETRSAALMKLKSEQPPPSPRKIDPAIPRDLETIVLKSCALNPRDRYQTAGLLRDDLIRFKEGRAIAARRVGLVEQAIRWSARNPMIAALSSLTLVLAVAVAVVALISNQRIRVALNDKEVEFDRAEAAKTNAETAFAEAKVQRLLAESNFTLAIQAFEKIMNNISQRGIPQGIAVEVENEVRSFETSLTASDVEVLEILLNFFAVFAEENKADLSYESAFAQRRVGLILQRLGRLTEAEASLETAIARIDGLDESKLPDGQQQLIQMQIYNEMAYCANRRGAFDDAETYLAKCRRFYQDAVEPSNEMKLEMARALNVFTSMYTRVGYVINRKAVGFKKNNPKPTNNNSKSRTQTQQNNNSRNKKRTRKPYSPVWISVDNLTPEKKEAVRQANSRAIALLNELIKANQSRAEYRLELSRAYQDSVRIYRKSTNQRNLTKAFDEAKKILEDLVLEYPNNPAYQFELADMLCNLQRSNNGLANPYSAARVAKELVEKWPNVSEYQALYANALARSAVQRIQVNAAAVRRLEEAINIYRELIQKFPDYYAYKINFIQYLTLLGSHSLQSGNHEAAEAQFDEAQQMLGSFETEGDENFLIEQIRNELDVAKSALN